MRYAESPSSCYTYDHCPRKYKFRYIEKLPDPSGPAAELGKTFEDAVYTAWNNRSIPNHEDPKIEKMLYSLFTSIDVLSLPAAAGFQEKIDVVCGGGRLLGYMDMRHIDNSITDIKTSKKQWDEKKLSETEQHIAYPYGAVRMGLLQPIFPIVFRYVITTTTENPSVQVLELSITESDFLAYEKRFSERIKKIELEIFPTKRSYECNWCPYKKICPAWN